MFAWLKYARTRLGIWDSGYQSPIHKVTEPKEEGHANKYIRTQVVNTMVRTWVWKERWELINFLEVEVKVDEQRIRKCHLSWVLKYKSLPRLEAWDGYERRKEFWLRVDCHECISSSYNFPKITLTNHLSPKLSSQKCQWPFIHTLLSRAQNTAVTI